MRRPKPTHEKRSSDTVATQFTLNREYDKQSLRFYQTQTRLRKILNYVATIAYHKNLVLSIFFKKIC